MSLNNKLLDVLKQKSTKWERFLFKDFSDLYLYHKGALNNFFITDKKGEINLYKIIENNGMEFLENNVIKRDSDLKINRILAATGIPNLNIELTTGCTARCKYCYLSNNLNHKISLDKNFILNIVDQAISLGVNFITLTGGDPLIHDDFLLLVEEFSKKDIPLNILTNGIFIDENFINKLSSIRKNYSIFKFNHCNNCKSEINIEPDKVICPYCYSLLSPIIFQISLDSYKEEIHDKLRGNGTYSKALNAIKLLKQNGYKVSVSMTVTSENITENIADYIQFVNNLGVNGIRIGLLEFTDQIVPDHYLVPKMNDLFNFYKSMVDELDRINKEDLYKLMIGEISVMRGALANVIPKRGCLFCKTLHLSAKGNLLVCPFCPTSDFNLGNLHEITLAEALVTKASRALSFEGIAQNVSECQKCLFKTVCGSGCRSNAYFGKDSINGVDPYCEFYKKFYVYLLSTLTRFKNSPRNLTEVGLKSKSIIKSKSKKQKV